MPLKIRYLKIPHKPTPELDAALIAARSAMKPIQKSRKGNRGNHAHIDDVIDTIEKQLLENNITWYHDHVVTKAGHFYKTTLRHVSGQERSVKAPFYLDNPEQEKIDEFGVIKKYKTKPDTHALASYQTYMRRYALMDILGLKGADEDSDATFFESNHTDVNKSSPKVSKFDPKITSATAEMLLNRIKEHGNPGPILANYQDKFGNKLTPANAEKKVMYLPQTDKNKLWKELFPINNESMLDDESECGIDPLDMQDLPF